MPITGGIFYCRDSELMKHPKSASQIIFFFTDEFIKVEDELIVNGYFIFDTEVTIDDEMSKLIGFDHAITIKSGEYRIENDRKGWNLVIADIFY